MARIDGERISTRAIQLRRLVDSLNEREDECASVAETTQLLSFGWQHYIFLFILAAVSFFLGIVVHSSQLVQLNADRLAFVIKPADKKKGFCLLSVARRAYKSMLVDGLSPEVDHPAAEVLTCVVKSKLTK
ncbi:hypothetical protein PRIPAC_86749 [Pristionchus pacificus]|uniref:Uncharacterized protein n=1 Tax=Pristionchus pacificus TaxID=54126 RepID=A0A2A6BNK3_PRIPA|nr:hypothetical protein PRIPAC_86749 [Pristionchus pacificus]|eukprot:PDM67484.1 hypothetical protein PRIPAC_48901 [Pristionchus pacificus]